MNAERVTALYVVVSLYFVFLLGVAVWSFIRGRKAVESAGTSDASINEHFLASRSFGTILLFLTTFSTIISGYTAFNIPDEAAGAGFWSLRWLQGFVSIILGYAVLAPRYRRLSMQRRWHSPNDIVADRFNSNTLRIAGAVSLCAPLIMYIAVQFISLSALVQQLSDGEIAGDDAVWFLAFFIWICEVIGGFRSVSLTDAIQSGIMFIAFLGVPFLLLGLYGGIEGINKFPICDNFDATTNTGCLSVTRPYFNYYYPRVQGAVLEGEFPFFPFNASAGLSVVFCSGLAAKFPDGPDLTATPVEAGSYVPCLTFLGLGGALDGSTTFKYVPLGMMSFSIALGASALQPHWAQRLIAAKSDTVVKKSLMLTSTGLIIAVFPGVMIGLTKAAIIPNVEGNAFPAMLAHLFDIGGFSTFFSVVVSVAAIAAFMSTADSAAIGISNVLTIELFRNWLTPNKSNFFHVCVAKGISLFSLIAARVILYSGTDFDILKALNWQIGLGWAVIPTYFFALYGSDTSFSAYSVLAGLVVHYIFLFAIEFSLIEQGEFIFFYSGIYAVILNFFVIFITEKFLLSDSLRDDAGRDGSDSVQLVTRENFGGGKVDHLTDVKVQEIMADSREPITSKAGQGIVCVVLILMFTTLPWYGDDGWNTDDANNGILIGGIPQWAFILLIGVVVEYVLLMVLFSLWKTDDSEYEEAKEIKPDA